MIAFQLQSICFDDTEVCDPDHARIFLALAADLSGSPNADWPLGRTSAHVGVMS